MKSLEQLETLVHADPFGIRPGYAVQVVRSAIGFDSRAPDVRPELYVLTRAELDVVARGSSSS